MSDHEKQTMPQIGQSRSDAGLGFSLRRANISKEFYCRKCCGTKHKFDGNMIYIGGCDKCKKSPIDTVEVDVA